MSENNDLYFGGCPECRDMTVLNIGRNHYGLCHTHKVKWDIGSNLFSNWRNESEDQWMKNAAILEGYKEIEPLLPPRETTGATAMTLDQIDQLAIVKSNLALLSAVRLDELHESAQFGFDRMIAEALSIVSDIVDSRAGVTA